MPTMQHYHTATKEPRGLAAFGADADKRDTTSYFEQCLQLVRPEWTVLVDNVLFRRRVADPLVRPDASPPGLQWCAGITGCIPAGAAYLKAGGVFLGCGE